MSIEYVVLGFKLLSVADVTLPTSSLVRVPLPIPQ